MFFDKMEVLPHQDNIVLCYMLYCSMLRKICITSIIALCPYVDVLICVKFRSTAGPESRDFGRSGHPCTTMGALIYYVYSLSADVRLLLML